MACTLQASPPMAQTLPDCCCAESPLPSNVIRPSLLDHLGPPLQPSHHRPMIDSSFWNKASHPFTFVSTYITKAWIKHGMRGLTEDYEGRVGKCGREAGSLIICYYSSTSFCCFPLYNLALITISDRVSLDARWQAPKYMALNKI